MCSDPVQPLCVAPWGVLLVAFGWSGLSCYPQDGPEVPQDVPDGVLVWRLWWPPSSGSTVLISEWGRVCLELGRLVRWLAMVSPGAGCAQVGPVSVAWRPC